MYKQHATIVFIELLLHIAEMFVYRKIFFSLRLVDIIVTVSMHCVPSYSVEKHTSAEMDWVEKFFDFVMECQVILSESRTTNIHNFYMENMQSSSRKVEIFKAEKLFAHRLCRSNLSK